MSIETLKTPEPSTIHPDLTKPQAAITPKHNQKLPDHDKIIYFDGKFAEIEEEEEDLRARKKVLKKQAINQGIVMKTFQEVRKSNLLDPETQLADEERRLHYLQAFNSPIGTQLSLFPAQRQNLSAKELLNKAFQEGRALGINAKDPDHQKWQEHTEAGQEHRRGWLEGQKVAADYFMSLQESDSESDAAGDKKAAERKQKAQEKADAKRDAAAKKAAEKEAKAAEKKAAAEAKKQKAAAKKPAAKGSTKKH